MKLSRIAVRVRALFEDAPLAHGIAIASAAAMLVFAPAAHAVVVTSPAAGIVVPATTAGVYINVVSGAFGPAPANSPGWDINPWGAGSLFVYGPAVGTIVTSANSPVAALTVGSSVGTASAFSTLTGGAASFGSLAGQWTLNATNYFGFKFVGDDALTHYGYGTMIVGSTPLIRAIGTLRYESLANTAITVAVPEPASWALMLAGGVGVAGAAMRRRRKAAAA